MVEVYACFYFREEQEDVTPSIIPVNQILRVDLLNIHL